MKTRRLNIVNVILLFMCIVSLSYCDNIDDSGNSNLADMLGVSVAPYGYDPANPVKKKTPPEVLIDRLPVVNGKIHRDNQVIVLFNKPMDASTINGDTIKLFDSSDMELAGAVTYLPENAIVLFKPDIPLQFLSSYTIKVFSGAGGVMDIFGNEMIEDALWSFITEDVPDLTSPVVDQEKFNSLNSTFSLEPTIIIPFSEAMILSTINNETVNLVDAEGKNIPITIEYNLVTFETTMQPVDSLNYESAYTLTVAGGNAGVADTSGNRMETEFSYVFTTPLEPVPVPAAPEFDVTVDKSSIIVNIQRVEHAVKYQIDTSYSRTAYPNRELSGIRGVIEDPNGDAVLTVKLSTYSLFTYKLRVIALNRNGEESESFTRTVTTGLNDVSIDIELLQWEIIKRYGIDFINTGYIGPNYLFADIDLRYRFQVKNCGGGIEHKFVYRIEYDEVNDWFHTNFHRVFEDENQCINDSVEDIKIDNFNPHNVVYQNRQNLIRGTDNMKQPLHNLKNFKFYYSLYIRSEWVPVWHEIATDVPVHLDEPPAW